MKPSSATSGFFQALPVVEPLYKSKQDEDKSLGGGCDDDPALRRVLALYLPDPIPRKVDDLLAQAAQITIAPSTLRLAVDAEINCPTLHPLNTFGAANEANALRTGEGWRGLKDISTRIGSVALGYTLPDGQTVPTWNRRIHQFATNHIWSGSAALATCPAAMTDGAAVLLNRFADHPDGDQPGRASVVKEMRRRLISFDPSYAWTSGQWMTERTGGSDVGQTETTAVRLTGEQMSSSDRDATGMPLGPWTIDGFKWFSSATDADMVVLLARTTKGISTFVAPMRRYRGDRTVMNGVRIVRLKEKLGTKALPTAELEILGMRGWLLGEEGKGIREISAILNTTRLWTGLTAVGGWSR